MDKEIEIRKKIADAINDRKTISAEELRAVYDEATHFAKTLPPNKRGAFYWETCMESLAMLVGE